MEIRDLAVKHLKIPIIIVGHLKRGQSDGDESTKRPKLTDFANAAAWDRYVRSAVGMWWEGNEVHMRIMKQNNGRVGGEFVVRLHSGSACVVGVEEFQQPEQEYNGPKVYPRRKS